MADGVHNQYVAKHGDDTLRVGHDIFLRWYAVRGKKWKMLGEASTQKRARDLAHDVLHPGQACPLVLQWELDESTRAHVLGECPGCQNPAIETDLKTYRLCQDCGWKIEFTEEEMDRLEKRLATPL